MEIESDFVNGAKIHREFTVDGENVNPEIRISRIPENSRSLVLIVDDPDAPAGTWVHWVLFNIPVTGDLVIISKNSTPRGAKQGTNSWSIIGYRGPSPPKGSGSHRYFFKVFALDCIFDLPKGSGLFDVEQAMEGHIISKGQLFGVYNR